MDMLYWLIAMSNVEVYVMYDVFHVSQFTKKLSLVFEYLLPPNMARILQERILKTDLVRVLTVYRSASV